MPISSRSAGAQRAILQNSNKSVLVKRQAVKSVEHSSPSMRRMQNAISNFFCCLGVFLGGFVVFFRNRGIPPIFPLILAGSTTDCKGNRGTC